MELQSEKNPRNTNSHKWCSRYTHALTGIANACLQTPQLAVRSAQSVEASPMLRTSSSREQCGSRTYGGISIAPARPQTGIFRCRIGALTFSWNDLACWPTSHYKGWVRAVNISMMTIESKLNTAFVRLVLPTRESH